MRSIPSGTAPRLDHHRPARAADFLPCLLFVVLFLVYALNFLYFFVDDEGIPLVYAQNVLRGRGLVYNPADGAVEGYSDFLHVWLMLGILEFGHLLGLAKTSAFFIGKALSISCGIAIVVMTFLTIRAQPRVRPAGLWCGLAFIALAGPLAVWSCSSLEAASFGLLITLLLYALAHPESGSHDGLALFAAVAAVLDRIDGFVFVGAIVGPFLITADATRRRQIVRSVAVPALVVLVVYQVWRIWYYGELLPMPVYAKVLYKLKSHAQLITKAPAVAYVPAFFWLYGGVPAALSIGPMAFRHDDPRVRGMIVALLMLTGYLSLVGDWMFGFRFFVPLLPIMAVLSALTVSELSQRMRIVGRVVAAGCILWFGLVAYRFDQQYRRNEQQESWLRRPSAEIGKFFSGYYDLYLRSRHYMMPGETTAYNQAGFLSFMLDLDNIDDLGICTKFFAELPTTDVFFTEVGRYSPLTNKRALSTSAAYLVYREPRFIISPGDLLRAANGGHAPSGLLDGYYAALFSDANSDNVVYQRTVKPIDPFRTDPQHFLENLTHTSHLGRAAINGRVVEPHRYAATFPYLDQGAGPISIGGRTVVELQFAEQDLPVYEIAINQLEANQPISVALILRSHAGVIRAEETFTLAAHQVREFYVHRDEAIPGSRFELWLIGRPGQSTDLWLDDVRVQGQTPELAAYVSRVLKFKVNSR